MRRRRGLAAWLLDVHTLLACAAALTAPIHLESVLGGRGGLNNALPSVGKGAAAFVRHSFPLPPVLLIPCCQPVVIMFVRTRCQGSAQHADVLTQIGPQILPSLRHLFDMTMSESCQNALILTGMTLRTQS